jgi:hypothetical protein
LKDVVIKRYLAKIDVILLQETQATREFFLPSHDA